MISLIEAPYTEPEFTVASIAYLTTFGVIPKAVVLYLVRSSEI
jgi:hypothetical protein